MVDINDKITRKKRKARSLLFELRVQSRGRVRISNDTLKMTGAPSRVYFREIHRAGYGSSHDSRLFAFQLIKKPIAAGFLQDPQNTILPADMNRPTSQEMT